ncbi:MAG TPA: protealysin inhibitor emfourin [Acidobacteriota bacterium]|nr:protealysin inhibitor emfourin [Acidobacteriota bacterium]
MKIRYTRSGGFANITTKVDLDSAELPPQRASEIHSLVEHARVFDKPAALPAQSPRADDLEHSLEITDGTRRHEIHRRDSQCEPELLRLFDRLHEELNRKGRKERKV